MVDDTRRAGGDSCVQPRVTRGDGAGGPPSRGKAGGAAEKAAEKEGLVANPSSSADSFVRRCEAREGGLGAAFAQQVFGVM